MEIKKYVEELVKERQIESVYFVGCGASKADLYPGYYFMRKNSKLKVGHFTANEFNYDTPVDVNEKCVIISASLSGTTPESVEAVNKANSLGAYVFALTNESGSPLTKNANKEVVHGFHESYAAKIEKMTYCLELAVEIVNQTEGYEFYSEIKEGFDKLPDIANEAAELAAASAEEFGKKYADDDLLYVVGSGASYEVGYSTSLCLLLEMQWINSANFHSGDFFHGALEITDKDVPFLLYMNDGSTRKMDSRVLTFLQRFDAKVTVIDGKDYGLSSVFDSHVVDYFNPMVLTTVTRVHFERLAHYRQHPLTKRRYMWKLEY